MASKAGEAYYEIYPQLNKSMMAAARAAIGKDMSEAFASSNAQMREENRKTQQSFRDSDKTTTDARRRNSGSLRSDLEGDENRIAGLRNTNDVKTQRSARTTSTVRRSAVRDLEGDEKRLFGERDRANRVQTSQAHSLATQFRTVGTITRGLSAISIVPIGFQALVSGIGAIQAALPIVAAGLIAIPGLVAAAGVEAIVLKVAFKGVGQAIKDGFDPSKAKQFNEELKKLAPSAQTFVKQIVSLRNIKWPNIQQEFFGSSNIQKTGAELHSFFSGLSGSIKGVGTANGQAVGAITKELFGPKGLAAAKSLFAGIKAALLAMSPGLSAITDGVLHLVEGFGKLGGKGGTSANKILMDIGHWLSKIDVGKVFHAAYIALSGFIAIGKQAVGVVSAIVKALGTKATGGAFLSGLYAILHVLNVFANSKPGQAFLKELFTTLSQLSNFVSHVLLDVLKFLAGAFHNLQPQIGPFLDSVKKLIDKLVPLGPAIGTIIGKLLGLGTGLVKTVTPAVAAFVKWITTHTDEVYHFGVVILAIWAAVKLLNTANKAAKIAIDAYKGALYLAKAAQIAWKVAVVAATVVQWLWNAALDANPIGLFIIGLAAVGAAIYLVITHFKQVTAFLRGPWGVAIDYAVGIFAPFLLLPLLVFQHWNTLKGFFLGLWKNITNSFNTVVNFFTKTVPAWFNTFVGFMKGVWSRITSDVQSWWGTFERFWTVTVHDFFTKTIPGWFNTVVATLKGVWNRVSTDIHSWWSTTSNFFTGTIASFFTKTVPGWFASMGTFIKERFTTVYSDIVGWWGTVSRFFTGTVNGFFTKTVPGWFNTFVGFMKGVWTRISSDVTGWWGGFARFWTGTVYNFFTKTIPSWFDSFVASVKGAFNTIYSNITSWWGTVSRFFSTTIYGFFTKTVPGWFTTFAGYLKVRFDGIYHDILGWWSTISHFFNTTVFGFFTKTVPGWFATFRGYLKVRFDGIYHDVFGWWGTVARLFNGTVFKFFTTTVPGWFTTFKTKIIGVFDTIKTRIVTFINHDVEGVFKTLTNFVTKTVPGWFGTLRHNVLGSLFSLVNDIQGIWHKLADIFEKPVEFVINKVVGAAKGLAGAWNAVAGALGLGKIKVPTFSNPGEPPTASIPRYKYATGGMIPKGSGGPTQDNVNIAVSGGEYVLNARSAAAIGAPYLNYLNNVGTHVGGDMSSPVVNPRFASGGAVNVVNPAITARVPATLKWLQSIANRVPYVLGANGPNAFDCSSLVGNVWARLTSNPINRRYFVTGSENNWLLSHGFSRGPSSGGFDVGLTSPAEHTVGKLAGQRFEAAHTGTRMRYNGAAANADSFSRVYHMTGLAGLGFLSPFLTMLNKFNGKATGYLQSAADKGGMQSIPGAEHLGWSSIGEKIRNLAAKAKTGKTTGGGLASAAVPQKWVATGGALADAALAKAVEQAKEAAAAAAAFGGGTNLSFANASQLEQWIAQASKYVNIPASWVPGIMTIIRRESGGNPNAVNHSDANARAGHPSQGLMQTIPSTFYDNVPISLRGRGILDPVANIAAAVNYIHKRYGTIFNVQQANPHLPPRGYAHGGPVLVRDHGGPIPTGYSTVYNGTGATEWVNDPNASHQCNPITTVIIDGVDVTSKAHVTTSNKAVAASLKRRSKL